MQNNFFFLKHMHEYPGILSGGRTVHSSLLLVATSVLVNQALHSPLQYKPSVTDIGKVFLNIFLMQTSQVSGFMIKVLQFMAKVFIVHFVM